MWRVHRIVVREVGVPGRLVGGVWGERSGLYGKDLPNRGVYLEVVPNERLVSTDAYTKAWEPSEKPFMTLILTFEDDVDIYWARQQVAERLPEAEVPEGIEPHLGPNDTTTAGARCSPTSTSTCAQVSWWAWPA